MQIPLVKFQKTLVVIVNLFLNGRGAMPVKFNISKTGVFIFRETESIFTNSVIPTSICSFEYLGFAFSVNLNIGRYVFRIGAAQVTSLSTIDLSAIAIGSSGFVITPSYEFHRKQLANYNL